MDFSFLSQPASLQLPDPQALAIRGMTLANLSQQNQEGQMKLDALRQAQDVKQAAAKVFGDAQTMGWDAAIKKAAQEGNTLGAAAALQLRRQDEGDAAKIENDRAQANERNSAATKNTMAAKAEAFKTFAPLVTGIASGQVPVSDRAMSAVYENARAILPDNVVRTMPADPAQFKQWATQFADPETLTKIWEKQQTVPATVAKDYATAGKANAEVQYMPREVAAREMSARASATSAGAAATNAQTSRMQYENPLMQHVGSPEEGVYSFNPKTGAAAPTSGVAANPIPKLTEAASNAVMFGMRAIDSDKTLAKMEQAGYNPAGAGGARDRLTAERMSTNWLASPEGQQYISAGKNFVAATLRKESGAQISDTEWRDGMSRYIPMPGDSDQARAQKQRNRDLVKEGFRAAAGRGASLIDKGLANVGDAPSPSGKPAAAGDFPVQAPDGKTYHFKTESAAREFKARAGML